MGLGIIIRTSYYIMGLYRGYMEDYSREMDKKMEATIS